MNIFTEFKKGLAEVLKENLPGSLMQANGLCQAILIKTNSMQNSYEIMCCLLDEEEYHQGLGPDHIMTTDRWYFGMFLLSLSDKELSKLYDRHNA